MHWAAHNSRPRQVAPKELALSQVHSKDISRRCGCSSCSIGVGGDFCTCTDRETQGEGINILTRSGQ